MSSPATRICPDVGRSIPAGNVMFETDFPHPTCLYGDVHERLDATFTGVDDAIRRQLVWDNAVNLYRLEVPAPAHA